MLVTSMGLSVQVVAMNIMALPIWLAASKGPKLPMGYLIFGCAILLTLGLAVMAYYFVSSKDASEVSKSRALFRELCKAHQLTNAQSHLLWRLADALVPGCPAALFVDSNAWKIPEAGRDNGLTKKDWDKLQIIQKTLFLPRACTH